MIQTIFQKPHIFRWGVNDDDSPLLPSAIPRHVRFPLDESSCLVYHPSTKPLPPATGSAPNADRPSGEEHGCSPGTEWAGVASETQPNLSSRP